MLFTSYEFLFLFLPIALAGFAALRRAGGGRNIIYWLILCSIIFYGWWSLRALAMLIVSVVVNFLIAKAIRFCDSEFVARRLVLAAGIAINVALLALFKYEGFLAININAALATDFPVLHLVLPLGISFFTFQQIIYLVDSHSGHVGPHTFADYFAFVTFFPHLIAGPLIHQGDVLPQFAARQFNRVDARQFSEAVTIFSIGLAKKVLLADGVAVYANPVFAAAAAGGQPSFVEAWCGAIAYTLQLYFDFSGYSDMAIGLAAMFGVVLPLNFYSPYKALNIIDFWRRWHMTLSRFLRDYLYIPLGGNRRGSARRYLHLMVVMAIGGIWHGAGWTFAAWGGLHGVYLCVNHFWRFLRETILPAMRPSVATRAAAWLLTFLAVVVGWVVFRSDNWTAVQSMLSGMIGVNGLILPETYLRSLGPAGSVLLHAGVRFEPPESLPLFHGIKEIIVLLCLLVITWTMPNGISWVTGRKPSFEASRESQAGLISRFAVFVPRWTPSAVWALMIGSVLVVALLLASRPTEFLYFQF
jgi:alginate O-acetyltransferase complex protein AlgI